MRASISTQNKGNATPSRSGSIKPPPANSGNSTPRGRGSISTPTSQSGGGASMDLLLGLQMRVITGTDKVEGFDFLDPKKNKVKPKKDVPAPSILTQSSVKAPTSVPTTEVAKTVIKVEPAVASAPPVVAKHEITSVTSTPSTSSSSSIEGNTAAAAAPTSAPIPVVPKPAQTAPTPAPKSTPAPAAPKPAPERTPAPVAPALEPSPAPVAPAPEPSPAPVAPAPEPTPAPVVPAPEPSPAPVTPAPEPTPAPATGASPVKRFVPRKKATPPEAAPVEAAPPEAVPADASQLTPVEPDGPKPSSTSTRLALLKSKGKGNSNPTNATPSKEAEPKSGGTEGNGDQDKEDLPDPVIAEAVRATLKKITEPEAVEEPEEEEEEEEEDAEAKAAAKAKAEEAEDAKNGLTKCPNCGRKFGEAPFEKHARVCKSVFVEKRKAFDMKSQRLQGNEEALQGALSKKGAGGKKKVAAKKETAKKEIETDEKGEKVSKWKAQSEAFQAAMKASKTGAPPPPSQPDPSLVQCPYCSRRFGEEAAEKHIPRCPEKDKKKGPPMMAKRR